MNSKSPSLILFDQYIEQCRQEKQRKKRIMSLIVVCFIVTAVFQVFGFARINSDSMEPDYHTGDIIIYYKLHKKYKRQDPVIVTYQGASMLRTVIGVPKDYINIDNETGKCMINGKEEQNDAVTLTDPLGIKFPISVKDNQYFVLCNNRQNSLDSRKFGCLNKKYIKGKVLFVF